MKQGSILVGGVIFKTGVLEERSKKTVAFLSKAKVFCVFFFKEFERKYVGN